MIDECDDSFWCVSNLYYFNKQFVKAIKSAVEKKKCRKQKRRKKMIILLWLVHELSPLRILDSNSQ